MKKMYTENKKLSNKRMKDKETIKAIIEVNNPYNSVFFIVNTTLPNILLF